MMEENKSRKKLTVIPSGGLANRMMAIVSGVVLADETNRNLEVIWRLEPGLNADFKDIFETSNLPFKLKTVGFPIYYLIYDIPRKKNLWIPGIIHKFGRGNWLYHSRDVALKSRNVTLQMEDIKNLATCNRDLAISSCYPFYGYHPSILKKIFCPNHSVLQRMDDIRKDKYPDTAIQIRRTDNKLSIENSPAELFEEKIKEILSLKKDATIFLATDDEEVKRHFKSIYPLNIIINEEPARRDTKEGMIDAFAEMMIMSECDLIYGSYASTYSKVAANYGNKPLTILRKESDKS